MTDATVHATPRIDAVLPLTAGDTERAGILFRSLEEFFEPLRTCHVVVPDAQVEAVRPHVPGGGRYALVPESELVPEIGWFWAWARTRGRLRLVGPPIHGWFVQQLVKLAAWERIATPFYLTLDADVICVRPTAYEDLVPDGRALVQTTPPNHPEWNDDAERVLGLPRSGRQYGVTPAVLSREAVRELARHLAGRVPPRWAELASWLPRGRARDIAGSWRSYLLRSLPWTEYAVYGTFVERTGLFDAHHVLGGPDAIYAHAVWIESQFEEWDAATVFESESGPCFSVIQSATRIPPERVWAKVGAYLEAPSGAYRRAATSS